MKARNSISEDRNDKATNEAHLLQGDEVFATYHDPGISLYRNNPFIEALPPILSFDDVIGKLSFMPPYDPAERSLPTHLRMHCINAATQFFQPLPQHIDLERRIATMIRAGYLARNPNDPKYFADHEKRVSRIGEMRNRVWSSSHQEQSDNVAKNRYRCSQTGFAVVGIPGIGKTTAIESILTQIYPQVIIHEQYCGKRMSISQVAWLLIGCPYNGSLKGLCFSFFQGLDLALGTNYYKLYSEGRRNIDELQDDMTNLAGVHGLGVLVVDELQHLTCAGVGAEKMLNFFVDMANCLKVPVLLVGTFKAIPVLSNEFRQIRRNSGQGDMVWEAMSLDENWDVFVEALWEYQYTRIPTPLSHTLKVCLHDACQGITDFAVKMYMLAQVRAIANGGDETITENIIRSVVLDSFRLAAPVLEAMRKKQWDKLGTYKDVRPIDLESQIRNILRTQANLSTSQAKDSLPQPDSIEPESPLDNQSTENTNPTLITQPRPVRKKKAELPDALHKLSSEAGKAGASPYTILVEAGIVRPVMEFLEPNAESV